jgi:hypothetical protein
MLHSAPKAPTPRLRLSTTSQIAPQFAHYSTTTRPLPFSPFLISTQTPKNHNEKPCPQSITIIYLSSSSTRNKVRIIIIDKLNPRRYSFSPSLLVQPVSLLLEPFSNSCNTSFKGLE